MKEIHLFVFIVLFTSCLNQETKEFGGFHSEDSQLHPNQSTPGSLSLKNPVTYNINLDSGTFVFGIIDQQSVDVAVTIFSPSKKRLANFDGPAVGPETFFFDTNETGLHQIEVAPFKEDTGDFEIILKRIEAIASKPAERVDQLLVAFDDPEIPGAAVGVFKNGKIIFEKGYGSANLAYNIPFTSTTRTNIGSVSKQFTATAILLLEQQGKLSLQDDVRKHIPELKDFGKVITIHNLLNHMSGWREIYNTMPITGWGGEDALRREDAINLINNQPELQADPGSEFNYNNTGFILLAETVERVTGEDFPTWMKDNIFEPLGMNNTRVRANPKEVIPNSSMGYVNGDKGYEEAGDLNAAYGAGGIYTTIEDFGKWLQNFDTGKLGGKELIEKLTTRGITTKKDTLDYALGIGVGSYRGLSRYQHSGADIAHRAILAYYPEIDAGIACVSNNAGFSSGILAKIADVFFADDLQPVEDKSITGDSSKVVVDQELLKNYAGKYKFEDAGLIINYTVEDEGFFAQATGQSKLKLIAMTDSTFNYEGIEATVTFHRVSDGLVNSATHMQGSASSLIKLPPYDPVPKELSEFIGKYFSEELETYYEIKLEDSFLIARHRWIDDITLTPTEEDSFSGSAFFINELKFNRDKKGMVHAFEVSNGRTKKVLFEKQD